MKLRVFYGYMKLTAKVMRHKELAVFFENANNNPMANEDFVARRMKIICIRNQSDKESSDAHKSNRMFTKYGYRIDKKPFNGNIEKVLEVNYQADSKNVSLFELELIRDKLRNAYKTAY